MITKTCKEEVEITNVANKINDNVYEKEYKIFGVTFFHYRYTLKTTVKEKDQNKVMGFARGKD